MAIPSQNLLQMPKLDHIEEEANSSGSSKRNSDASESDQENRRKSRRHSRSNSTGKTKSSGEKERQIRKTTTFVAKAKKL